MVVVIVVVMVMIMVVVVVVIMTVMIVIVIMFVMFVVINVRGHMTRQTGWGIGMVIAVPGIISGGRSRGECHSAETGHGSSKGD
jgi:hypothetical protein